MLSLFAYPKVARVRFLPIYPILFPGLKNFNELAENVTKKDLCYFKPQKSIRQVWNDATAACSKLTKKTNQERLNVSTKLWENKDNVKTVKTNAISKKRRRESCESPLPTEQPKTKRPKLVLKAEKLIDSNCFSYKRVKIQVTDSKRVQITMMIKKNKICREKDWL